MFRKFIFCCYYLNLNKFENFKYPQFVWNNIFTYDNSFIFQPQCHALASLFLNMPPSLRLPWTIKEGLDGV